MRCSFRWRSAMRQGAPRLFAPIAVLSATPPALQSDVFARMCRRGDENKRSGVPISAASSSARRRAMPAGNKMMSCYRAKAMSEAAACARARLIAHRACRNGDYRAGAISELASSRITRWRGIAIIRKRHALVALTTARVTRHCSSS